MTACVAAPVDQVLQVLDLLGQGLDFPAIAKRLGIEVREVRLHVRAALARFNADNHTQAVAVATHRKLIPLNSEGVQ